MVAAWAQLWDEDGNVILSGLEDPDSPVTLTELDTGAPAVRAVTNDYPNRSGQLDTSTFFGGRAVSLTFMCTSEEDRRDLLSKVMPLIDPRRRPRLVVMMPEWGEDAWMLPLRADSFTAPLTYQQSVTTVWVNPTGVWESATETSVQVNPMSSGTGGIAFPYSFPMAFAAGSSPSAQIVNVDGSYEAAPKILIYGPITQPTIALQNKDQKIQFSSSTTIAEGDYFEIDVAAGTILANSDSTASRFGSVDWSASDLWLLSPGDNQIALTGSDMSTVTQATVSWRDRRI